MKDFLDFAEYLDKLLSDSKPLWGEMTAQHMVEHLILAVQSSNGKKVFDKCMNSEERYPILKRFLLSERPLPKGFVNTIIGEGLKPLKHKDLNEAKEKLIMELSNFYNYYEDEPSAKPMNVTFGPLEKGEWITFHNKHFTHHFTQFGLMRE
ncbi:MAG: hypothetical protein V3V16_02590 [Melioribacteraceae bacterium]